MKRNKLGRFIHIGNLIECEKKVCFIKFNDADFVLFDEADANKIKLLTWHLWKKGVCKYAKSNKFIKGKYYSISMHRFLTNPDKKYEVDHIDNNGLNNRRNNLRIVERKFNKMNLSKYKSNTSGYKGVHCVNKDRWQARIQIDGKRISLGCYATREEAALAYNAGAIKYHGEFSNLNVILP